jgi:hypothetical protein
MDFKQDLGRPQDRNLRLDQSKAMKAFILNGFKSTEYGVQNFNLMSLWKQLALGRRYSRETFGIEAMFVRFCPNVHAHHSSAL